MFMLLLLVTFIIAALVSAIVTRMFTGPIDRILNRIISDDISTAWTRYMVFAIYVVGISGGVRIWELERYITAQFQGDTILELTGERWVLEIYRTIIGTLQSVAWLLLAFFIAALIAYVIIRVVEIIRPRERPAADK